MNCSTIMAIVIDKRTEAAPQVQEVLTDYGCLIETRLGLHEMNQANCPNEGMIILSLCGEQEEIQKLQTELEDVDERVKTKTMELDFD